MAWTTPTAPTLAQLIDVAFWQAQITNLFTVLKISVSDAGNLKYSTLQAKTTTYPIIATDDVITCNGTFTVTLPDATTCAGRFFNIKSIGTGVITIATVSAQTIDGASTYTLQNQYQSATIYSTGATWLLI